MPKVSYKPEEVRQLLLALPERYRTIAVLAAVTGVRASELFALSWADIDFEQRAIHIRRSFYRGQFGPPKSKASERVIALGPGLTELLALQRQRTTADPRALVFPNAVGKPYEPKPRAASSAACHAFCGSAGDGMARVPAGRGHRS